MTAETQTWSSEVSNRVGADEMVANFYFGPSAKPDPEIEFGRDDPQGFLVQMGAETYLQTHYHPVDQFQVFVGGRAIFGHHAVEPGTVHYSDRATPYGPLQPSDQGVSFLTLRARTDSGAFFMPESRDHLREHLATGARPAGQRRNITMTLNRAAESGHWCWPLDEADGAKTGQLRLTAEKTANVPAVEGSGAYLVAIEGIVEVAGTCDIRVGGKLVWMPNGASGVSVRAKTEGCLLVFVQLPHEPVGSVSGRTKSCAGAGIHKR